MLTTIKGFVNQIVDPLCLEIIADSTQEILVCALHSLDNF
jgi:hypothetical protein